MSAQLTLIDGGVDGVAEGVLSAATAAVKRGRPVMYEPEDCVNPHFANIRWSDEIYERPGDGARVRQWAAECVRCGATVVRQSVEFRLDRACCDCRRDEMMAARNAAGALGELAVKMDLLRCGWAVFSVVAQSQHPDLVLLNPRDRRQRLTVEVRVVGKAGERERKKTDDCDHYAWVERDGTITYEPPLPPLTDVAQEAA